MQGPTEVEKHNQEDLGLSSEDVRDITWWGLCRMGAVQEAVLQAQGYTWSLMLGRNEVQYGSLSRVVSLSLTLYPQPVSLSLSTFIM